MLTALISLAISATPAHIPEHSSDSAAIVASITAFHAALETADSAAVRRILAEDAVVVESGSVESRAEYLGHHLGADIEFARAIKAPRKIVTVTQDGKTAWVVSTSLTSGTYKGRTINSDGAELMVLTRSGKDWKIRAIHWSSARRQSAPAN